MPLFLFAVILLAIFCAVFTCCSAGDSQEKDYGNIGEDEEIKVDDVSKNASQDNYTMENEDTGIRILSYMNLDTPVYGLMVKENNAYIGQNYAVVVVDVKDKSRPLKAGLIKDEQWSDRKGWAINLCSDGEIIYLGYDHKLDIFNIADTARPVFISGLELDGFDMKVRCGSGRIFIAASTTGTDRPEDTRLYTIDVADPHNPEIKNNRTIGIPVYGMEIKGDIIFLAGTSEFVIMDVSDIGNPAILSRTSIEGWGNDVAVGEGFACMVGSNGLTVFDISNMEKPEIIKELGIGGYGQKIFIEDNKAYVLLNSENAGYNLMVIDIEDSFNPEITGSLYLEGIPQQICVDGNYIYVACTGIYEYPEDQGEPEYIFGRLYILEQAGP